jgi:hypothetical protein
MPAREPRGKRMRRSRPGSTAPGSYKLRVLNLARGELTDRELLVFLSALARKIEVPMPRTSRDSAHDNLRDFLVHLSDEEAAALLDELHRRISIGRPLLPEPGGTFDFRVRGRGYARR